jgi:HAMP domain-containing protein
MKKRLVGRRLGLVLLATLVAALAAFGGVVAMTATATAESATISRGRVSCLATGLS